MASVLEYSNPLELIDHARAQGLDTWEALVALGASDEGEIGLLRWRQGDLALRVEKQYGEKSLAKYASEIGVKYPTLRQRREMSAFYTPDTRDQFENLFYTHYREAKRFAALDMAMRALNKASLRSWPITHFAAFIDRCVGKAKSEPHIEGTIAESYGGSVLIKLDSDVQLTAGQVVVLRVKA